MLRAAAQRLARLASARCRVREDQGRGRSLCSGALDPLAPVTEALERAATASRLGGPAAAAACRSFIVAHDEIGAAGQAQWWAAQALAEEEAQLQALSRALPRGGRVAPQLLDAILPAEPATSEATMRRLVAALGSAEGLATALHMRGAARAAAVEVGPQTLAGFALERLDRRLQDVLGLWFQPGFMRVQRVGPSSSPQVLEAAAVVAYSAAQELAPRLLGQSPQRNHRCFALSHAHMDPEGWPLLVAHASLLPALPGSLMEAVLPDVSQKPQAACLWALGVPPQTEELALQGLGLDQVLRRGACEQLRAELVSEGGDSGSIAALVPLQGFTTWIRAVRAWEHLGLKPAQAEALRRAAQGAEGLRGEGAVSFVDVEGDTVHFRLRQAEGSAACFLEAEFGGGAPRRVLKLVLASEGKAVRFLVEPGPEALQVNATDEVAGRGDLLRAQHLAEAAGLLPAEFREPVLRLAYDFITRRSSNGHWSAEPLSHFHMLGGAALHALHWRADESVAGLADSLGVMSSFVYRGPEAECEAAAAYESDGLNAATFTTAS